MSKVGWLRLVVIVGAVGALEVACRAGWINHRVVIPPSEMADALVQLLISGKFNEQIARSFGLVIAAIIIAVVAGFIVGVIIHALPRVRQALDPFFAT
jgi:NitT/TauT family transport system permease protein